MTDEMMQANQVPLVERLQSVPANAHLAINTPNPLGHDTQHFAIGEMCHKAAAQLAALEMELEAAKRDAARYRWLRGDAPTHSERWPRWNLQRWDGRCWHSLERGALDAAIDAAMKD